jgi:hypothetical protein
LLKSKPGIPGPPGRHFRGKDSFLRRLSGYSPSIPKIDGLPYIRPWINSESRIFSIGSPKPIIL